ncbi:hypothetical protein PR202_gb12223 [Eleusine coracana subsp. coracana]|uniref:Protein FAR1-RELATED SEQUENCE n=1 Tax=Eleusine coracana subsp. coracana TaxID=191504 RepID=A0AAV5EQV8_ELECO|nr:hypothetical protein PR202_gb12223 [Eleusine coracana subsp. coracana]
MATNESIETVQENNAGTQTVVDEDEFVIEEVGTDSDDQAADKDTGLIEPRKDMIFRSENDAVAFYRRYAQKKGFIITRRSSKIEDEKVRYFTLACSRQGKAQYNPKNKWKPKTSSRVQCPAKINFCIHDPDNKFRVTSLTLEHNHDLCPSEKKIIVSQKKPDQGAKRNRRASNGRSEVRANKKLSSTRVQAGDYGNHQFGDSECVNSSKEERRHKLGPGDVHVLYRYFFHMQSKNPNFSYVMDFDEDSQLRNDAAEKVFPETCHRWCLWNIMKKISKRICALSEFENIKINLSNVVYESLTKSDFDKGWLEMIGKFGLQNNEFLTGLYLNRQKWVPAHMKDTFWAGMCSTQECECDNAFIDVYVKSGMTLNQFLEQYNNALRNMVEKENNADLKSFQEVTPCITHYDIEKQFQLVYTNKKFEEFQEQVVQDVKIGGQQLSVDFTVWFKGDECDVRSNIPANVPSNLPASIPGNLPANIPTNLPTSIPSNLPPPALPAGIPENISTIIPATIPANLPATVPTNLPATVPPQTVATAPPNVLGTLPATIPPEMMAKLPADIPPEMLANIQASGGTLPTNVPPEVLAELPAMQGQLPVNVPPEVLAKLAASAKQHQPTGAENATPASGGGGIPLEVMADLAATAKQQPGAAAGLPVELPKMPDFSGLASISFPPMPSGPKLPEMPQNISMFGYEVPIPKFINKMVDGQQ